MTIQEILKKFWGYNNFRPLQQEIIESILSGNDTLALLPTSAGKSICFQIPALAMEGICIVVSPLIALMKNQVENLKKKGIKAVAIYSGLHKNEIDTLLDNCIYGDIKFLYVSPERLKTDLFIERAKKMNISLIAVDEAHCISQWGYDFRPSYLDIIDFKTIVPKSKFIALTASATKEVKQDIIDKLGFVNTKEFRLSFERKNISYSCFQEEDKDKKLLEILTKVKGSGIIYVGSRKRTKLISMWLNQKSFNTDYYHAGLTNDERNKKQDSWITGKTAIIVSTNAFGMGIDKPNVRFVVHLDIPQSIEAYYQEAGRAGRDEQKAYAVLLFNSQDLELLNSQIIEAYPEFDYLRRVYQMLANYFQIPVGGAEGESFPFKMVEFVQNFNLKTTELMPAINILQTEGFISLSESFQNPSKYQIIIEASQLYDFRLRNEQFDSFLKLILRIYGGDSFTDLQTIDEQQIAKHYMISVEETIKMLELLAKQKIILYQKQSQTPYITFIKPRFDAKQLPINEKNISFRKNRDISKANAVINYGLNKKNCRSKIILEYFNETSVSNCGTCDVCLAEKKKLPSNSTEIEEYKNQIFQLLQQTSLSTEELKNTLLPLSKNMFIEAIKILLEDNLIYYNNEGSLALK